MDFTYMGKLLLSMLIFAPGLLLVGFLSVLGVYMMLEKLRTK